MKFLCGDIHKGDCLDVMVNLPGESVDLILCDLPYGTTQNKWDSVIPLNVLWEQYRRIIKPKGVIALSSQASLRAPHLEYEDGSDTICLG